MTSRARGPDDRSPAGPSESPASRRPLFPVETHELDNGLTVVLSQDRSVPLVAVHVSYNVGSSCAPEGRSGLPHLIEHLFFEGSAHVAPEAHFHFVQETGGTANASTWYDSTSFFETVPASELDLALWLEADRMGFLRHAVKPGSVDKQRDVILSERREKHENQPYGAAMETLLRTFFPTGHPYARLPMGEPEGLRDASLDEVVNFLEKHYGPANAVLVLCGDFDPSDALERVQRFFGGLPSGEPAATSPAWIPMPEGERRAELVEEVHLPRLYQVYEAPAFREPDYEAADVLTFLLSQGRSSRLHRELVRREGLASDVSCFTWMTKKVGLLFVVATAFPETGLDELEAAVDGTLKAVAEEGVEAEELEGSLNWGKLSLIHQLNRLGHRADAFANAVALRSEPGYVNRALRRYAEVSAEDIQRVAAEVFRSERRAVLRVVPGSGKPPSGSASPVAAGGTG